MSQVDPVLDADREADVVRLGVAGAEGIRINFSARGGDCPWEVVLCRWVRVICEGEMVVRTRANLPPSASKM